MPAARPGLVFPWKCTQCLRSEAKPTSLSKPHIRTFTSTQRINARSRSLNNEALNLPPSQRIPPQSPRYVDIPKIVQPRLIVPKRLKGVLPIPRAIFNPKDPHALDKAAPARLAAMKYEPRRIRNPRGVSPRIAAHNDWKSRLAAQRRENLREGLAALAGRVKRRRQIARMRSEAMDAVRSEEIAAADRADDFLTRPSTTRHLRETLSNGRLADPNREERLAGKAARAAAHAAAKEAGVRGGLHDLYMTAREFIVTDAALEKAIEAEFGTQDAPRHWRSSSPSVWALGPQPTVQELVAQGGGGRDRDDARSKLMSSRLKRVAETLTGGKM